MLFTFGCAKTSLGSLVSCQRILSHGQILLPARMHSISSEVGAQIVAQGQQLLAGLVGLMPTAGSLARRLQSGNHVHRCCTGCHAETARICCRYTVSQHPKVEAKIVAELQRLGLMPTAEQPQPRDLEYADMSELTYLQAVVKVLAGA